MRCGPLAAGGSTLTGAPAATQKWSKGKMKEKVNNLVLFDKVRRRPLKPRPMRKTGPTTPGITYRRHGGSVHPHRGRACRIRGIGVQTGFSRSECDGTQRGGLFRRRKWPRTDATRFGVVSGVLGASGVPSHGQIPALAPEISAGFACCGALQSPSCTRRATVVIPACSLDAGGLAN
jgi:hypothetical protein